MKMASVRLNRCLNLIKLISWTDKLHGFQFQTASPQLPSGTFTLFILKKKRKAYFIYFNPSLTDSPPSPQGGALTAHRRRHKTPHSKKRTQFLEKILHQNGTKSVFRHRETHNEIHIASGNTNTLNTTLQPRSITHLVLRIECKLLIQQNKHHNKQ